MSLAPTNDGDISRTPCISPSDHQLLRWSGEGGRTQKLRVNATALALATAQRKRGYCRSFDNVTRSSGVRHRYKPAFDYLYVER